MTTTPGQKLAEAVKGRRAELGVSQQRLVELASAKGRRLSFSSVRNVEAGSQDNYYEATLTALDAALDWPDGHAASVLGGGPPVDVTVPAVVAAVVADEKAADVEVVMALFDCLTPEQRRVVFLAARAWVEVNPDYVPMLGTDPLAGLQVTAEQREYFYTLVRPLAESLAQSA